MQNLYNVGDVVAFSSATGYTVLGVIIVINITKYGCKYTVITKDDATTEIIRNDDILCNIKDDHTISLFYIKTGVDLDCPVTDPVI